jgi:hypothetical protein
LIKDCFLEQFKRQSSKELPKFIKQHEKQAFNASTSNDDNRQLKETNSAHANIKSKQSSISEVTPYELDNLQETQLQHPICVPIQTSFAMNSIMPRVPTKATLTAIDDDEENDDERSYDNYLQTSRHIITTNEQFENIPTRAELKSENPLLLKVKLLLQLFYLKQFFVLISKIQFCMINQIGLITHQNLIFFSMLFNPIFQLFNLKIDIHHLKNHFFLISIVVQNLLQQIIQQHFTLHLSMLQITYHQLCPFHLIMMN